MVVMLLVMVMIMMVVMVVQLLYDVTAPCIFKILG